MTAAAYEYERCEYIGACRYRLDVYSVGTRAHFELHDLHSLDEHGFSQVVFEGSRREDVDSVVTAIGAVQSVDAGSQS